MNIVESQSENLDNSMGEIAPAVLSLRQEFDLGFAQLPRRQAEAPVNFLGIRFGNDAFAIRVADISGLHTGLSVVPMPSSFAALLGVCRVRSLILPVFDLAALLGYSPVLSPRWTVLIRSANPEESIALGFENFDSFFSAALSAVIPAPQLPVSTPENAKKYLYDAVKTGGVDGACVVSPIIHLPSLPDLLPRPQRLLQKGATHHD